MTGIPSSFRRDIIIGLVAFALGAGLNVVRSQRKQPEPGAGQDPGQRDRALDALLEEVRALRQDVNTLNQNVTAGQVSVANADRGRDAGVTPRSSYAVAVQPQTPDQGDGELSTLLEEVRSLQQDIDILKTNPNIGAAVTEALQRFHDSGAPDRTSYAVLVSPASWRRDPELRAIVAEVGSLRQDLTALEASPEIGNEVAEALKQARESGQLPQSSYAVAVLPQPPEQHEHELQTLLDAVQSLRQSIDLLKANPQIGDAVTEVLRQRRQPTAEARPSYAVLV